jgi:hypothetical protein
VKRSSLEKGYWIVPGGACSFTAIANKLGASAVAADILYQRDKETLQKLGEIGIQKIYANTAWMATHNMSFYKDLAGHRRTRESALRDFLADFDRERYKYAKFPHLRLAADSFDLCLSGHFLFTYDDRFDYEFHLTSIISMAKIAKEVRIFPLVDMNNSRAGSDKPFSPFVYRLIDELPEFGLRAEIVPVDFEFQRGAGFMMKICKK